MPKRFQFITILAAVLGLAFLFMACGGSGGGSSVTYNGSTDPAVADSTTAPTLAEYGIGSVEAGFPLASPFAAQPPEMMPGSLAAQPLAAAYQTTVTISVPSEAVINGIDYSPSGSGS